MIVRLTIGRGQPLDDIAVVDGAKRSDLDENLVSALLNRIRSRRGSALAARNDDDILRILSVTSGEESEPYLTLAGLLALGRYPQQFFPQLNVTFVAFPAATGRLAEELGISRQSVLRWLKIMEKDGQVEPTEATPQSPRNRWRLTASESTSR